MKVKVKKVLSATGVAAAVAGTAAAVSGLITDKLVKVAMCRNETVPTAGMNFTSSIPDWEEISAAQDEAAQRLKSAGSETVEIEAADGTKLVGHWLRTENAKRTMVAMHGWRSSWDADFGMVADFLHSSGCNVLFAEQRGQGESGGDYMGFGLLERYDCLDWVRWVNANTDSALPIYLVGLSMGASTVLMAAGLELPENVRGIIADCGFTSADAIWRHVVKSKLHLAYGPRSVVANDLCRRKIQIGAKDYSTTDALALGRVPVLLIHGTDDHFVPVEMTYENYKACTGPKRILIIPGADHGLSYWVDKSSYELAVKSFWSEFDGGK